MKEILTCIPVLLLTMTINIVLGMYYQIGTRRLRFSKRKFLNGIAKASVICFSAVGLSYCFEVMDLSSIGTTPAIILQAAILAYTGKDVIAMAKILGVSSLENGKSTYSVNPKKPRTDNSH